MAGVRGLEVIRKGPVGVPGRPPLLLVHGAWHAAWCWDWGFMDLLADQGHEVVALSLRGHGGSWGCGRFAVSRHGLAGYVDDLAAVAADLGRPAVLVGHSMGGFVVQRYLCEQRPALGAVLLAPVPSTGVLPLLLRLLRSYPAATAAAVAALDLGRLLRDPCRASKLLFTDAIDAYTLSAIHPLLGGESFRVFLELLAPRLRLPRALTPVAVLAAGDDAMFTPEEARATAAVWGTRPVVFDGTGHDMMLTPGWETIASVVSKCAIGTLTNIPVSPTIMRPISTPPRRDYQRMAPAEERCSTPTPAPP